MERDRGGQQKRNLTLVFTSPTCFPKISRKATFESAIFKTGNGESENRRMKLGMGNAHVEWGTGNGESLKRESLKAGIVKMGVF